jgi:hypothetical protein
MTTVGNTAHFTVQFDETSTPDGNVLGQALLATCEADNAHLSSIFGGINLPHVTVTVDDGPGGQNDFHNITHCGSNGRTVDFDYLRNTFIAELDEIYMVAQNKQWNPGDSKGEALSRALGGLFYPGGQQPGFTVHQWVDALPGIKLASTPPFQGLQDWVNNVFSGDNTTPGDNDSGSTGCGQAFINYLHYQLGFTFSKIVGTSGSTLAEVYTILTGSADGFGPFAAVVRKRFPQGVPSGLNATNKSPNSDSFFPLASDKRLSVKRYLNGRGLSGSVPLLALVKAAEAKTLKGLVNTARDSALV